MATNGAPEHEHDAPHNIPPGGSGVPGSGGGFMGIPTKWLIIGGGGIGGVALVAVVVAVLFLFVIGGGSPQPGNIMDLLPARADSVAILDIKAMLADDYINDVVVEPGLGEALDELDDRGIDREGIEQMIAVHENGAFSLVILQAAFDPQDVQYALEDEDFEDDNYRGYTIWVGNNGSFVMLEGGYLVGGDSQRPIKNVLNNLYQGKGALSKADDDNKLKRILDKLGSGILISADVSGECGDWNEDLEDCEGYGTALTEADADREEGNYKYVALFRNERYAEDAAGENYDSLDEFFVYQDLDIDDAEADGEFVTGTATDW